MDKEKTLRKLKQEIEEVREKFGVEFAEVKHGRWKYFHKQNIAVCTSCSFERDLSVSFGRAVSCPNCGAEMSGGADHD